MAERRRDPRGQEVAICAGSGGVGKTTTSAALAAGLAARGQKVAVLTIDPAKRLADSLGLEELGNEPRQVDPKLLRPRRGRDRGRALGDDARRQGDLRRAGPQARAGRGDPRPHPPEPRSTASSPTPSPARRSTWRWRSCSRSTRRAASTSSSSTRRPRATPSTSSTPPKRLTQFIEGRGMQMFMKPTGIATKVVGRGQLDGSRRAEEGRRHRPARRPRASSSRPSAAWSDGFQERAKRVNELLADPHDQLPDRLRPPGRADRGGRLLPPQAGRGEAPVGGVIVNKVHYEFDGDRRRRRAGAQRAARRRPARSRRRQLRDYQALAAARRRQHRATSPAS